MHVLVNAVAVQGGGGRTYLLNVLAALAERSPHDYTVVLTTRQSEIAARLPARVRRHVCRGVPRSPWLRILWEQAALPVIARRQRADVLFAAFNTAPLASAVPVVLVQHTVNPYSALPIRCPAGMRACHAGLRWLGRRSAAIATHVVFVSETSARFMAPLLGARADRVRVIHYGWHAPDAATTNAAEVAALPDRFLLTVGDLLEHKNVETLLDAFERLVDATGYPGHLVVVGRTDGATDYGARLRRQQERLAHGKRVQFVGAVPPAAMTAIYRRADLFVLPSLEETFGLPLVEALGAETPVVAADWRLNPAGDRDRTNVGPEICGDAAVFFDPTDAAALAAAMARVLADDALRDELRARGRPQAARFSWNRAADDLLRVFDEAAG